MGGLNSDSRDRTEMKTTPIIFTPRELYRAVGKKLARESRAIDDALVEHALATKFLAAMRKQESRK